MSSLPCAAILDDEAGRWSVRPDTTFRVERACVEGSMVFTTFHTASGTIGSPFDDTRSTASAEAPRHTGSLRRG